MEILKILEQTTKQSSLAKWTKYKIELPKEPTSPLQCWGVDPGTTHVGITVIPYINEVNYAHLYQIEMPRWKDAVDRIVHWQQVMGEMNLIIQGHCRMVVEGAAYGSSQFRQVELAEIRAATVLWAYRLGMDTKIVPPSTIRKCVFGTAKLKAHDVWYLQDAPDALAALSCAYYASDCWEK
jgi:Holliday junction resolvasome RuvABC endonuclease subunit